MADAEQGFIGFFSSPLEWPSNLSAQLNSILNDSKSARTWINIAIILGGYMLIRPLIIKGFASTQFKSAESKKVLDAGLTKGSDQWNEGLVSANALRATTGGVGQDGWGAKKRKSVAERQKEVMKKMKKGEAGDEDMLDLLVDYDEGEDGW